MKIFKVICLFLCFLLSSCGNEVDYNRFVIAEFVNESSHTVSVTLNDHPSWCKDTFTILPGESQKFNLGEQSIIISKATIVYDDIAIVHEINMSSEGFKNICDIRNWTLLTERDKSLGEIENYTFSFTESDFEYAKNK